MEIKIDNNSKTLEVISNGKAETYPLYSKSAFEILSDIWVKVGWNQKYAYTFSWMGRPVIQLPEDMIRIQEIIYQVKPDVIIETGVAHGGSLIYYASLCKAMDKGKIIGVDIEIRPKNRAAINAHELSSYITLIEGNAIDKSVVDSVVSQINPGSSVLIILDSCHTLNHVLAELEMYSPYVTPGSYIIATDGVMKDLYDVPRGEPGWKTDNPVGAINEFTKTHPEFLNVSPDWPFNESELTEPITHWPGAYLQRK